MKLTWFGGTTVRIHIGGAILVVDPEGAPDGIDAVELVSGADRIVHGDRGGVAVADPLSWRPPVAARLIDTEDDRARAEVWSLGGAALLVAAAGEPPLLLVWGDLPDMLGNWATMAVFVLVGEQLRERSDAVAQGIAPRLIVLAGAEDEIDLAFAALEGRLDGTGLVALEAGLALEI